MSPPSDSPFAAPNVLDLVGSATLEAIRARLEAAVGVPVVICDPAGHAVTDGFHTPRWCKALGCTTERLPDGLTEILTTWRTLAEPGRVEESTCPGGLTRLAAPIVLDKSLVGVVLIGDRPIRPIDESLFAEHPKRARTNAASLRQAASEITLWTTTDRTRAGAFLSLVSDELSRLCAGEQALETRLEEVVALSDMAGMVAEARDVQEILDRTAERITSVMRAHACSIRLLDAATGVLTIRAVHNLSPTYLNKGPVTVMDNPIDAAALGGETVYVPDVTRDPRTRYKDEARREGLVSSLCVGMAYRRKPLGVIRVYTAVAHRFSTFESAMLRALAAQAAVAIANSQLAEEAREADAYERQLKYAGEVQRRMIPAKSPAHARLEFGGVYSPSLDVGGDFYDFIEFEDGAVGLAICDVVGHGVPASLLMASIRGALRAYAHSIYDVDEIIARVNRAMCRDTLTSEFATLFYGVFSADGRRLTYCNAGHDPPMLMRRGAVQELGASGPAIGVIQNARYTRTLLHLEPGDLMLLYTDGTVEALNFHDEAYGRERLVGALAGFSGMETQVLPRQIQWDVKRFMGLSGQTDDITIVAARVKSS